MAKKPTKTPTKKITPSVVYPDVFQGIPTVAEQKAVNAVSWEDGLAILRDSGISECDAEDAMYEALRKASGGGPGSYGRIAILTNDLRAVVFLRKLNPNPTLSLSEALSVVNAEKQVELGLLSEQRLTR